MTLTHICMIVALALGIGFLISGGMMACDKADEFCAGFAGLCGLGCIAAIGALVMSLIVGGPV